MTLKSTVALGMLALATLTGCSTGSALLATDTNTATDVQASPSTPSSFYENQSAPECTASGGWFDRAAGVCDDSAP